MHKQNYITTGIEKDTINLSSDRIFAIRFSSSSNFAPTPPPPPPYLTDCPRF